MKKIWSILRWLGFTLGVAFIVLVVGIGVFIRTERCRDLVRDQLISTLNTSFRGEVSVERLEGSLWNELTLRNLLIRYQGIDVLRVPRLTASYALAPLLQKRVQVTRVEIVEPVAQLVQDSAGTWNLLEALSAREPQPPSPESSTLIVLLNTLTIQGARIIITPAGEPAKTYHLTDTSLDGQVSILPAGLEAQLSRLATNISAEGLPPLQAEAILAYQGTTTPATVRLETLKLDTIHSHVRLRGTINDLSTMDMAATLTIENLAASDLAQLVPDVPFKQDTTATLQLNGPLSDLHSVLSVSAADAHVTAEVHANLTQEAPQYTGTITIAHLDAQKFLSQGDVAGILDGTVQVAGAGTALTDLQGKTTLQVQALQVGSWQIGTVSLHSNLDQGKVQLSGEGSGELGHARWQGEVHLLDGPRYDLTLTAERLNIKKVAAGQEPLDGVLNLKGMVKGKGLSLPQLDAQTEIEIFPSVVGTVEVQRGRLAAHVAGGRVQISEATLVAKDTTLAVKGELGVTPQDTGQLSYALQVPDLSPWLALVEQKGSGALSLHGTATGSIANLQVQGELGGENLHLQGNDVQQATITVNLAGLGQAQPQGTVTAVLKGVRAGTELREAVVTATLQPGQPLSTQLVVTVQDAASHNHRLKADVVYQPEQVTVHLHELVLALPEGSWRLAQPGTIAQRQTDLILERLLLVNGDQQLLVDGNLSLTGTQELRAQISRLALAGLRPLLPQQPDVHGLLTAQINLSGTAAAPQLAGTVQLADLQIAGQSYQGLSTTVAYKERNATVEVNFQQDADHALTATGLLPLAVSWAQGWNVQILGGMDARIRSTGVNLAFLNAFTGEAAQNVAGELNVDLALQGPVSHPRPQGSFRLRDGQAMLKALGVQIAAITIDGTVDPEHVRIQQIAATAQDGSLQGNATLTLRDYQPQRLTASLTAERWPAIHTSQYQLEIAAQLRCEGPITAPTVNGRLEVLQGILRPDLEGLADSPVRRDETIVILQTEATSAATKSEEESVPVPSQGKALQNLALDVTVQVQRNTWIKHQNADIELAGEVRATKQPEGEPMLVGTIETVRGWVGFKGRRFTLSEGRVSFSGESEINPQLDIIAQHQFPEYRVDTVIGGTAKAPSLTLRSDPELEQADILALLLFGKRANALGSEDKTDLQQQALGLTAGYAASQIAQSVSQALGLEDLGIDLREADIAGGHVGFGRYLSPNTYVSISQEVGGKRGQEVSVDYYLSPSWQLNTSTNAAGSGAGILWHKQY